MNNFFISHMHYSNYRCDDRQILSPYCVQLIYCFYLFHRLKACENFIFDILFTQCLQRCKSPALYYRLQPGLFESVVLESGQLVREVVLETGPREPSILALDDIRRDLSTLLHNVVVAFAQVNGAGVGGVVVSVNGDRVAGVGGVVVSVNGAGVAGVGRVVVSVNGARVAGVGGVVVSVNGAEVAGVGVIELSLVSTRLECCWLWG